MALGDSIQWYKSLATDIGQHVVRMKNVVSDFVEFYERNERPGYPSGWTAMEKFYRPVRGELNIVTGYASHGKSEWLDALMVNLAVNEGLKFFIFSPENEPYYDHIKKLIEKFNGSALVRYDTGEKMTPFAVTTGMQFVESHFAWADIKVQNIDLAKIVELFIRMAEDEGYDGFVIDPWNYIEHSMGKLSETQYISVALSTLAQFARKKNVLLYVVAHPAKTQRDGNGRLPIPDLMDISGSMNWKNKADNGIVVYRPDLTAPRTEVYFQKIRRKTTGMVGGVSFRYERLSGRFMDCMEIT